MFENNNKTSALPNELNRGPLTGDIIAATSVLHLRAAEIRNETIKWQSYLDSSMISKTDYKIIMKLDSAEEEEKNEFLQQNRIQCAKTFFHLLGHISKDQTLQYILVMISDLTQEENQRIEIFHEYAKISHESAWTPFLNLLNRQDPFITNLSARIISKMACASQERLDTSDLNFFLTWLKDQLTTQNEYIQSVTRCLQMMLRIDIYRYAFINIDGVAALMNVLSSKTNFQIQYQTIYCIWVMTFNKNIASMINRYKVVTILSDILSDSGKEKVNRIILAVFRNLIENVEEPQIAREHCMAMIQSKMTKQLSLLEQKKYDDADIIEDLTYVSEQLQITMQDLSSFEEYAAEVKSGRLEWSPVHKSNFWRENAQRLNENNNELLKILINLLQTSKNPTVLCVASFDIGEYVRHYPRGKHIIEQLGGKQLVMQLLTHEDLNVRYEALLAVQKIMVHHWESLVKQLERGSKSNGKSNLKSSIVTSEA